MDLHVHVLLQRWSKLAEEQLSRMEEESVNAYILQVGKRWLGDVFDVFRFGGSGASEGTNRQALEHRTMM